MPCPAAVVTAGLRYSRAMRAPYIYIPDRDRGIADASGDGGRSWDCVVMRHRSTSERPYSAGVHMRGGLEYLSPGREESRRGQIYS